MQVLSSRKERLSEKAQRKATTDWAPVEDCYLDLKKLSLYSSLSVRTLRNMLKGPDPLPHYRLKGKILVKRSDFDRYMERFKAIQASELRRLVDEVVKAVL